MYDEKDLKTILSRAIQIQKQNEELGTIPGSIEKLSLNEIEEIARESGLSPEYVREAAVELEGIPIEKPFFLDTGKSHEIELLGHAKGTIDQKTWAELRSVIEKDFKTSGVVRRHPDGIHWTVKPTGIFKIFKSLNNRRVELQNSGFRTIIRIKKNLKLYRRILYPAYASLAGAIMFFTLLLQSSEAVFLIPIAILLVISKLFFKWADLVNEKSRSSLQDTMAQLQTIINRKYTANEQGFGMKSNLDIDLGSNHPKKHLSEPDLNQSVKKRTH